MAHLRNAYETWTRFWSPMVSLALFLICPPYHPESRDTLWAAQRQRGRGIPRDSLLDLVLLLSRRLRSPGRSVSYLAITISITLAVTGSGHPNLCFCPRRLQALERGPRPWTQIQSKAFIMIISVHQWLPHVVIYPTSRTLGRPSIFCCNSFVVEGFQATSDKLITYALTPFSPYLASLGFPSRFHWLSFLVRFTVSSPSSLSCLNSSGHRQPPLVGRSWVATSPPKRHHKQNPDQ
ncbi:hypothetical protein BJ322DRAFT_234778 [Thelephora terrestris]|uniref:Uncharacterized protein n=1 Tax=Thelephora terrestris TaxID=56493 RepID=A0A9P6L4B5_9AGAM|nr:hypothetical protein BJ322DRAFT_234778 [Thelephora terrestris]